MNLPSASNSRRSGFGAPRKTNRSIGTRAEQQRILIVCGGVVTEVEYLTLVKAALKASGITIRVEASGRSPMELAEKAAAIKQRDIRDAKRSDDSGNVFNNVWVITDVDNFGPAIPATIQACASEGIRAVVSNPCFELWLVLHKSDHRAHSRSSDVQARAKQLNLMGANGKSINRKEIVGELQTATTRAKALRSLHLANGTVYPDDNPSTNVDELVESLVAAAAVAKPGLAIGL